VQAEALLGYAREMAREGTAPPPAYIALGMLVEACASSRPAREPSSRSASAEFSRTGGRKRWKRVLAMAAAGPESHVDDPVPPDREGRRG